MDYYTIPFASLANLFTRKSLYTSPLFAFRSTRRSYHTFSWTALVTPYLAKTISHANSDESTLDNIDSVKPSYDFFSERTQKRWGHHICLPTVLAFRASRLLDCWLNRSPMELLGLGTTRSSQSTFSRAFPLANTYDPLLYIEASSSKTRYNEKITDQSYQSSLQEYCPHIRYVLNIELPEPKILVVVYHSGTETLYYKKIKSSRPLVPVHVISITLVEYQITIHLPNYQIQSTPALIAGAPEFLDAVPHKMDIIAFIDDQHKELSDIAQPQEFSQLCSHFDPHALDIVSFRPVLQVWPTEAVLNPEDMLYETESDEESEGSHAYTSLLHLAQDTLEYIQMNSESAHVTGLDRLVPKLTEYLSFD